MLQRRVAVLGAGVAGLSAAILLARDGHRVTLVERDDLVDGDALSASGWRRSGIPHFLQPHAFIPRGVVELRRLLPDV
jgi:glycine/D-amino acid oxidase-like deaminating enzyme